jgi:predicted TIM-barrel fold metal-dependent hydrolase
LRFPKLRIALSEGGIGWVPMFIDRLRHMSRMLDYREQFGALHPVDVLRRNFWFTTFNDALTMPLRHLVGLDHIMVETDYPHGDSTWPDSQELLAMQLKDVPESEADAITFRNAAELYGLNDLLAST